MSEWDEYERGMDEERERIIRDAFTDAAGEWIYSVFERLDTSTRREITRDIEEALAFFKPGDDWKPSVKAMKLLEVLDKAKTLLIQVQINTQLKRIGYPLTRKTFGPVLRELENKGFVSRPNGERGGAVIT